MKLKNWISCAPFEQSLGIEILEAHAGKAELRMPFMYAYANGAATTHMEVDFLYPVMQGWVRASANVVHAGERTWDADVSLYDDREHEVMQMRAIFKLAWRQLNLSQKECDSIPGDMITGQVGRD
ncbi:MAG: PaaI family thioesterase [Geobacteraceae bacterium]|nr:PaaI family thioesterase [Geobacteraceae bacterium]